MHQLSFHGPPDRCPLVDLGIHQGHRGRGQVHRQLHQRRRRDHRDSAAGIRCYPPGHGWDPRNHLVRRVHDLGIHRGLCSGHPFPPGAPEDGEAWCRGSGVVRRGRSGMRAGPFRCFRRRGYCPDGAQECGPSRCFRQRGCCPDAGQSGADLRVPVEDRLQASRVWAPRRPASPGLHQRRATERLTPAGQRLRLAPQRAALEPDGLGSGPR